jgi:hypothetical protein
MCDKCHELDKKIGHYEKMLLAIGDSLTVDRLKAMIADLQAQKAALQQQRHGSTTSLSCGVHKYGHSLKLTRQPQIDRKSKRMFGCADELLRTTAKTPIVARLRRGAAFRCAVLLRTASTNQVR